MVDDTARHEPPAGEPDAPAEDDVHTPTFAEYLDLQGTRHEPDREEPGELVGAAAGAAAATRAGGDGLPTWTFPDSARQRSSRLPLFAEPERGSEATSEIAEPQARAQPMFGPVGASRPAAAVPLLAVLTIGLSALRWSSRLDTELEEFDPQLSPRSRRGSYALALPWLLGFLTSAAGAVLLVAGRSGAHLPGGVHAAPEVAVALLAGLLAVPYLVVLLPFSLVTVVMRLERLRCVEEHVGMTSDRQVRPVGLALLLLVPVAGGLILVAEKQRRANAIWDAVARPGRR